MIIKASNSLTPDHYQDIFENAIKVNDLLSSKPEGWTVGVNKMLFQDDISLLDRKYPNKVKSV